MSLQRTVLLRVRAAPLPRLLRLKTPGLGRRALQRHRPRLGIWLLSQNKSKLRVPTQLTDALVVVEHFGRADGNPSPNATHFETRRA